MKFNDTIFELSCEFYFCNMKEDELIQNKLPANSSIRFTNIEVNQ